MCEQSCCCHCSCTNERPWVWPRNEHKPRRHVPIAASQHFTTAVNARRWLHQDGNARPGLLVINASTFDSNPIQWTQKSRGLYLFYMMTVLNCITWLLAIAFASTSNTFSLCGLDFPKVFQLGHFTRAWMSGIWEQVFTGQLPFLSPKQQNQSLTCVSWFVSCVNQQLVMMIEKMHAILHAISWDLDAS